MLDLSQAQLDALASGRAMRRDFVWFDTLDADGNPDAAGFWNDVYDVTVEIDGEDYIFHGAASVVSISSFQASTELSIPSTQITVSGVDPNVQEAFRGRRIAQRPARIWIGIYDGRTKTLIPPLRRMFRGFIDEVDVKTPAKGGKAEIVVTCETMSRSLTIQRTETRSHASEELRDSADRFYEYASTVREKPLYLGQKAPK